MAARTRPQPTDISAEQALTGNFDGELVRMRARVVEHASGADRMLVRDAAGHVFNVTWDGDAAQGPAAIGSVVDLVGICTVQVDTVGGQRTPRAFRLLLQSPADVVVVLAAPWWTTAYTLAIIGVMAAVILGGPGMGECVAEPRSSSNRAPPRGEGRGRGGEPRQERVPREHEPRDPHADERRYSG